MLQWLCHFECCGLVEGALLMSFDITYLSYMHTLTHCTPHAHTLSLYHYAVEVCNMLGKTRIALKKNRWVVLPGKTKHQKVAVQVKSLSLAYFQLRIACADLQVEFHYWSFFPSPKQWTSIKIHLPICLLVDSIGIPSILLTP